MVLDSDLAALYGVETKRFNEQVKRNRERFPSDFVIQLTAEEDAFLRSQFATLKTTSASGDARGAHRKYLPYAFSEHGAVMAVMAVMAAMVLNSPRAIEVSVYVVRAFVQLKALSDSHLDLARQLKALESKTESLAMSHESLSKQTQTELRQTRRDLKDVFDTLRELMTPPVEPIPPKRQIGFITDDAPLPKSKPQAIKGKAAKG
jgi:ORF6N domain